MPEDIQQNNLRFVWYSPVMQHTKYGTYLFNAPTEARATQILLKQHFPDYEIWLEDREGNRVAIPNQ